MLHSLSKTAISSSPRLTSESLSNASDVLPIITLCSLQPPGQTLPFKHLVAFEAEHGENIGMNKTDHYLVQVCVNPRLQADRARLKFAIRSLREQNACLNASIDPATGGAVIRVASEADLDTARITVKWRSTIMLRKIANY